MTDHPVLVETGAGVLGGIVTSPERPPAFAAVVLQGGFGTRAGSNQLWRRVSHGLRDLGVVTLRVDYPSLGESHIAEPDREYTGVREVVRWFRERTGELDLVVIALCAGLLPAAEVVREHDRIAGVAVIVPPLFSTDDAPQRRRASLPRRLVYRARKAPKRAWLRLRYGSGRQPPVFDPDDFARAPELLAELASRGPLWLLTGDRDICMPMLGEMVSGPRFEGCWLDVVPDIVLRASPTREAQREVIDRTLAWAGRVVQPVEVSS